MSLIPVPILIDSHVLDLVLILIIIIVLIILRVNLLWCHLLVQTLIHPKFLQAWFGLTLPTVIPRSFILSFESKTLHFRVQVRARVHLLSQSFWEERGQIHSLKTVPLPVRPLIRPLIFWKRGGNCVFRDEVYDF